MASSFYKTNSKLGFADFFDKSVFFNKKAGMMMYIRGDKNLKRHFLTALPDCALFLLPSATLTTPLWKTLMLTGYGQQKSGKWVVRNFWGSAEAATMGEAITSEEFTYWPAIFCFQLFPSGYCTSVDHALKMHSRRPLLK